MLDAGAGVRAIVFHDRSDCRLSPYFPLACAPGAGAGSKPKQLPRPIVSIHGRVQIRRRHSHVSVPRGVADLGQCAAAGQGRADERVPVVADRPGGGGGTRRIRREAGGTPRAGHPVRKHNLATPRLLDFTGFCN